MNDYKQPEFDDVEVRCSNKFVLAFAAGWILASVLGSVVWIGIIKPSEKKAIVKAVEQAKVESKKELAEKEMSLYDKVKSESNWSPANTNETYYFKVMCQCGNELRFPVNSEWMVKKVGDLNMAFKCKKCGRIAVF